MDSKRMLLVVRPLVASALFGCGVMPMDDEKHPGHEDVSVSFDAVYVVNGKDNSLSILDASARDLKATIALDVGTYPHHISLSPDRTKLAVAVPGMDLSGGHGTEASSSSSTSGGHGGGHMLQAMSSQVLLVDAVSGKVLKARDLSDMNHNAAFSPNGLEIWTSQMVESGRVLVLDGTTLETKGEITVGSLPAEITFSLNGAKAFVANGEDDTVSVIDVATKTVTTTISVGDNPVGAWPGADGVMYVDNETGKSISAIDPATMTVVRTYDLGFTPGMAATGPGKTLWVSDTDNGKVVTFAAGSVTKEGEIATGAGAHGVTFSPDESTAFVTNQMAATVSIIDAAGRNVVSDVKVGEKPNGLVFRKN